MKYFLSLFLASLLSCFLVAQNTNIEFPTNSGLVNVKDYGAKGDGTTDDTEAFKKAISENWTYCGGAVNNFRFLYVPNGTYLVTDQILFQRWTTLQGQSETGTIIKLKENSAAFQNSAQPRAVLRCRFLGNSCSPYDGDNNSSFANYIQHIKIEIGAGNPGAIGVQYNTHNQGAMRNVTITSNDGNGVTGLDLSETEFGPGLIKDVTINGFDYGIKTPFNVSHATMNNITLNNQKKLGMLNGMPLSIYNFTSNNSVTAIENNGDIAMLFLVKGNLNGGLANNKAIISKNSGRLNLREVKAVGYGNLLQEEGNDIPGNTIGEYITGEKIEIFPSGKGHLKLPVKETPAVFYEPISSWVYADPSQQDDTKSIQDAMNSGASTIYFNFKGDYFITNTIIVPATVKRIVGMNVAIQGNPEVFGTTKALFRIEGNTNTPISIEFLRVQAYPVRCNAIEMASKRPISIMSCNNYLGNLTNASEASGGDLFIEDQVNDVQLNTSQNVWLKHWNPENNPFEVGKSTYRTYMTNNGGNVWILGLKTEAPSLHVYTKNGGKTEVLGGFFRDFFKVTDVPCFKTEEGSISASFYTYDYQGCNNTRTLLFEETRNGEKKQYISDGCSKNIGLYAGYKEMVIVDTTIRDTVVNGTYVLIAKHSGKVLDVQNSGATNGTPIWQYRRNNLNKQKWAVTSLGNGYYKLAALSSGKVLDVSEVSLADSAKVHQWQYINGDNQKWKIRSAGNGYYSLTAKHSAKTLDVLGASKLDGATIGQLPFTGADNQLWKLESTEAEDVGVVTTSFSLSPNPTSVDVMMSYENINVAQPAVIVVSSLYGKIVWRKNVQLVIGTNQFTLPAKQWANGTYVVNLQLNKSRNRVAAKKLIKL